MTWKRFLIKSLIFILLTLSAAVYTQDVLIPKAISALDKRRADYERNIIDTALAGKRIHVSFQEAISTIPQDYGVESSIAQCILRMENSGKTNMNAVRFEPHKVSLAAKFSKDKEQQLMIARSHCPMQVMGYEAEQRGVSWHELYYADTCVELSMVVWNTKKTTFCSAFEEGSWEQTQCTATRYNGSGPKAILYGRKFMKCYEEELIRNNQYAMGEDAVAVSDM